MHHRVYNKDVTKCALNSKIGNLGMNDDKEEKQKWTLSVTYLGKANPHREDKRVVLSKATKLDKNENFTRTTG